MELQYRQREPVRLHGQGGGVGARGRAGGVPGRGRDIRLTGGTHTVTDTKVQLRGGFRGVVRPPSPPPESRKFPKLADL